MNSEYPIRISEASLRTDFNWGKVSLDSPKAYIPEKHQWQISSIRIG